jgi:hypothetical protein
MSVIEHAKSELRRANVDEATAQKIISDMERFFDEYDSGGAVATMFHTIEDATMRRLVAAKPLTPLTGSDDEWVDHGGGVFQNTRCSSVFKDSRFYDGKLAYDIDAPEPRAAISFPYMPDRAIVDMPIIQIGE